MDFGKIKPFVVEMITFVFVIIVIMATLLVENLIEISVQPHILTISVIVILLFLFIPMFSRIMNMGVKALFDFVFQRTEEGEYLFCAEHPYSASVFAENFGADSKRSVGMYYLIQAKTNDEIRTFISPVYIELNEGEIYKIKSGRSSHVVLNCNLIDM